MKKGLFAALFTLEAILSIPILTCYENNVNGRKPLLLDAGIKVRISGFPGKNTARAAPAKAVAPFWHTGSLLSATLCRISHLHGLTPCFFLAGNGSRTRDIDLGKVALYH